MCTAINKLVYEVPQQFLWAMHHLPWHCEAGRSAAPAAGLSRLTLYVPTLTACEVLAIYYIGRYMR